MHFAATNVLARWMTNMPRYCAVLWIVLLSIHGVSCERPCIPKAGTTGVIVGQDYGSILNYTAALPDHSRPFGFMSYMSLATTSGHIAGLGIPTDYGSGIEWTKGLTNYCQGCSIQIGLWLVDSYRDISHGKYDAGLEQLVQFVTNANTSFYLRIGYEFDGVANNYDTAAYIEAFRYIASFFRTRRVTNVGFVWHAAGFQPRDNLPHTSWFPGTDVVDWCGVSLFQQPYYCAHSTNCPTMQFADEFAALCSSLGVPLMIAESTPFGGIIATDADSAKITNEAGFVGNTWDVWFLPVLSFIERHDVRIWSYINCDWDVFPMWQKEHASGAKWGDTRLEAHARTVQLWRTAVLQNPRFLTSYPGDEDEHESRCDGSSVGVDHQLARVLWAPAGMLLVVSTLGLAKWCGLWWRTPMLRAHEYEALP